MPQIMCNIRLDVSVNDCGQSIMAKRGDVGSRGLCVRFTDCGRELPVEQSATVLLNVARGEERKSFAGAVDRDGCAVFTIPSFALEQVGEVLCDVSAINAMGDRLSTATFTLAVEDAVCSTEGLVASDKEDVLGEWIATESLQTLAPVQNADGFLLTPAVNRKYLLDLSDSRYVNDGAWQKLSLQLPVPPDTMRDAWVLISCHAPVNGTVGAVNIDWGTDVIFHHGMAPDIVQSHFDIICTYSHMGKCWQIGVLQYASVEALV